MKEPLLEIKSSWTRIILVLAIPWILTLIAIVIKNFDVQIFFKNQVNNIIVSLIWTFIFLLFPKKITLTSNELNFFYFPSIWRNRKIKLDEINYCKVVTSHGGNVYILELKNGKKISISTGDFLKKDLDKLNYIVLGKIGYYQQTD